MRVGVRDCCSAWTGGRASVRAPVFACVRFFFFQAEDGIRDYKVTGVQTCALPISNVTVANRIDLVLQRFGVVIDGFAPPPPGPLTDLAVTSVSGPSVAVQGSPSTITVAVKNIGNQDVSAFDVTLQDTTEHVTVGTQSVAGLGAGASTTV